MKWILSTTPPENCVPIQQWSGFLIVHNKTKVVSVLNLEMQSVSAKHEIDILSLSGCKSWKELFIKSVIKWEYLEDFARAKVYFYYI